jgi:uncharacterized protein YndB with AHSA1/START domain
LSKSDHNVSPPSRAASPEGKERAVFKIFIRGSMDAVWHELTKTDAVQPAAFGSRMFVDRLAAGGQLRMRTPNGKYTAVAGEILEVRRPRRFSHTFRFTNYDDPPCTVIYELDEVDDGVELKLIVEDMPAGTKTAKNMKQGGGFITKTLKAVVETGKPPFSSRLLLGLFSLLAPFTTPARCRSERWPL